MTQNLSIRLLTRDEAGNFRRVRLYSLQAEPASFFEDYTEASKKTLAQTEALFDSSWLVGAFLHNELVAIAGMTRFEGEKQRHKAHIWGVYAKPEIRGQGAGKSMVNLLIEQAKQAGVELIQLSANEAHSGTVSLYESLGFKAYGVEEHILKTPDGYVNDVLMVRFL